MDDDYWRIVNDKLYSTISKGRNALSWNGPNRDEYEDELRLLRPHFNHAIWGVGSAFSVFLSFRLSANKAFMNVARHGPFYKQPKLKRDVMTKLNAGENAAKQLNEGLSSMPVDLFLATMIGCSVTMFLADLPKMKNDLAKIPLVKGRSLVSDELCHEFISLSKPQDSEISDKSLQDFVLNCQKRIKAEDYLKTTQADCFNNEGTNFSIPYPGVEGVLHQLEKNDEQ